MYGVVSLLDRMHWQKIESLWDEMGRRFGIIGAADTPIPHFSYHVARQYDESRLRQFLDAAACGNPRITVRTAGIGVFSGPRPVLYLPVVRTAELSRQHISLWQDLETMSSGRDDYYAPEHWVPHITVGQGGITSENLGSIVEWLNTIDLNWSIPVDNLALLGGETPPHELVFRVSLSGRSDGTESR